MVMDQRSLSNYLSSNQIESILIKGLPGRGLSGIMIRFPGKEVIETIMVKVNIR